MKLRLILAVLALLTFPTAAHAASVGWGSDIGGSLGTGYASFKPATTPVGSLPSGVQADGTILTRSVNTQGEVGDGTLQRKLIPVKVSGLTNAVQLAGHGQHRVALLANGTVVTWGANLAGELGNGTFALPHGEGCLTNCFSTVPIPVPGLTGVVAVFAGGADDAALLSNGTVMAWGENLKGQLGDGTKVEKDVPTLVKGLSNVKTLALGGSYTLGGHTLALLNDGTVEAWGFNGEGQLGIGSTVGSLLPVKVPLSGVTAISASWTHNLAIAGGKLLAWGNNGNGELGSATTTLCSKKLCSTVPVQVPLEGATSISAGYAFSVVAAGGHAYAFGHNKYGQLGDGTRVDHRAPALVTGLEGVTSVKAGDTAAFATITGAAPAPLIEVVAGPGALTVNWTATGGAGWDVRSRKAECCRIHHTGKFSLITKLPATARSYTLTGTPGQTYEVSVGQVKGTFGLDVVEGTPLAGAAPLATTPRHRRVPALRPAGHTHEPAPSRPARGDPHRPRDPQRLGLAAEPRPARGTSDQRHAWFGQDDRRHPRRLRLVSPALRRRGQAAAL